MTSIAFEVPGPAVGKGRPRATAISGQARLYTPARTVAYEGLVALAAQQAMAGRPPLEGPVNIELWIECAIPASWSKRKRAQALAGDIRPTTKPDASNVLKAVEDGCNGVVYRDDVQIVAGTFAKLYGETPRVKVYIMAAAWGVAA